MQIFQTCLRWEIFDICNETAVLMILRMPLIEQPLFLECLSGRVELQICMFLLEFAILICCLDFRNSTVLSRHSLQSIFAT